MCQISYVIPSVWDEILRITVCPEGLVEGLGFYRTVTVLTGTEINAVSSMFE